MQYACAVCVGEGEQAVGFDQFYMRFDDLSSIKNNVQLKHKTKVCQPTLCPDCGRYHFKKDHLCEHNIKKIPCLDCGKLFVSQISLKLHIRVHQDSFVHACKFCLKKFKTKPDKQTHEESHPQEKKQGEGQEPIHQSEQEREKREPRKRRHKSSQRQTSDPEEFEEEGVRQINSDSDFNPAEERTTKGLNRTSKVNQPVTTTSSSAIYTTPGSLTVEITEELFGSDHDDDVATAPMERKSFCPQRRNLRNPREERRRGKTRGIVQMSGSRLIKKILRGAKAATLLRQTRGKVAEAEVTCTTRRHKMQYACAVCVGEGEHAVGLTNSTCGSIPIQPKKSCATRNTTPKFVNAHSPRLLYLSSFTLESTRTSFVHACRLCLKKFKTNQTNRHMRRAIPKERVPINAPTARKDSILFKKTEQAPSSCRGPRKPQMVTPGQKPYKCKVCQMSFNQVSHLKSHLRLQHMERPFKCQQCEKCFNHKHSQEQGEREKERNSQELNSGTEEKKQGGRSSPKEQERVRNQSINLSRRERSGNRERGWHKSSQRQTSDPEEFEEEGVRQINSDSDFNPAEERTT
ncbi:unnamed protein product, partial [Coregonus sp. 'balchen']